MLCTQEDVEKRLQVNYGSTPEPLVTSLIAAAQGHIEREYGGPLEDATYTDEQHDGVNRSVVFLRHHPVTAVTTVEEDGAILAATDYVWVEDGTVRRVDANSRSKFWNSTTGGGILVTYDAGYAEVDIPEDIRDVCAWLVVGAFRRGAVTGNNEAALAGVQSESLGSYSVTHNESLSDPAALILMTEEQRQVIREYRQNDRRRAGFGVA